MFIFIYFQWYWNLYSGPHIYLAGDVPLKPCTHPFFALVIFVIEPCIFDQGWPQTMVFLPMYPTYLVFDVCVTMPSLFLKWDPAIFFALVRLKP